MTLAKYTEDILRKIYDEIRKESFNDAFNKQLIFKDIKGGFGISHPIDLKMYIDINEINKYSWPEDAVRGLFAHELSHMVSYKRRSFIGRMWFLRFYPWFESVRSNVEKEADGIAIERGYGNELIQERIFQFKVDDKERVEKEMRVYLSVDALKNLVNKKENKKL